MGDGVMRPFLKFIAGAAVPLALACAPAFGQSVDDKWVVERVIAGKFDELRALQAQSDKGSPVAMYWWGAFLEGCVYSCDPDGARALWIKSARAGNSRAKLALMIRTGSRRKLDELIEKTGAPATAEERVRYAVLLGLFATVPPAWDGDAWKKAEGILKELAESERRMDAMYLYLNRVGFMHFPEQTRAMVEAGLPQAAEDLRRALLIRDRIDRGELRVLAAKDILVGVALCETIGIAEGREVLPPEVLPICEHGLSLGYIGIAPVLLRHHRLSDNARAASFFADLCAKALAMHCASELADYHYALSGRSREWQVWDAVAGIGAGFPANEAKLPTPVMQRAFSIRVRIDETQRACLARRYDEATKKFNDEPGCPARKPVAIPAEFLSTRQ